MASHFAQIFRRLVRFFFRVAVLLVLALIVAVWFGQHKLIYFARAYDPALPKPANLIEFNFSTSQGRQSAWYLPPTEVKALPQRLWLCCAGNGSLALDWLPFIAPIDATAGWLMVDYPGYGKNEGSPTPSTIQENCAAAFQSLCQHLQVATAEIQPRLGILGHSLGCAAALKAGSVLGAKRAVLIAPFTSMTDMGQLTLGRPLCWLNRHRFDNRATLDTLIQGGATVALFHGSNDGVIPMSMSEELAARHPKAITFTPIPGGGHADHWEMAGEMITNALRAAWK